MRVRVVKPTLFDMPRVPRPNRTTEAIMLSPTRGCCPTCAATLHPVEMTQPALFWIHGFGGMVRTVTAWCSRCGYHRHLTTSTINPR